MPSGKQMWGAKRESLKKKEEGKEESKWKWENEKERKKQIW